MWGDQQQMGQESVHVIWGGVERVFTDSSSTGNSHSGSSGSQRKDRQAQGYCHAQLNVEFLNQSNPSSSQSSSAPAKKSQPSAEEAAKHAPEPASSAQPAVKLDDNDLAEADLEEAYSKEVEEQRRIGSLPSVEQLGDLPSVGSAEHFLSICRPCLFVATRIGCREGVECRWCHLSHKSQQKAGPCKKKRDRYRKLVDQQEKAMFGKSQNTDGGSGSNAPAAVTDSSKSRDVQVVSI